MVVVVWLTIGNVDRAAVRLDLTRISKSCPKVAVHELQI